MNSKATEEKHIHWDISVLSSNHKGNSKAQQNKPLTNNQQSKVCFVCCCFYSPLKKNSTKFLISIKTLQPFLSRQYLTQCLCTNLCFKLCNGPEWLSNTAPCQTTFAITELNDFPLLFHLFFLVFQGRKQPISQAKVAIC